MKKIKKCAQLILIIFVVLLSSCSKQFTPEELYSKNMNSVVEVKVNCNDDNLYASAVCIDSNGIFVSNAHVIPKIDDVEINVYIRFSSSDEYEKVNLLKIDKSLIDELENDPVMSDMVDSIIYMGHIMDCEVISEGVENENQLEILKEHKCDFIQGFVWGRPLPFEEAKALCK